MLQGLYKFHQYQVVGRHLPTPNDETPQIYRMKLWATDAVRAKSKFWCVPTPMHRLFKLPFRSPHPLSAVFWSETLQDWTYLHPAAACGISP